MLLNIFHKFQRSTRLYYQINTLRLMNVSHKTASPATKQTNKSRHFPLSEEMPSECKISLNKEDEPFIVGQDTVEVTATLKTTTFKTVTEVYIRFYGRTKVRFEAADAESTLVEDSETLIDERHKVFDKPLLSPGTYIFKQKFALFANFLTSLESQFGHTRYEISVNIVNLSKYTNVFVKPITVIRPLNLNLYPELKAHRERKGNHLMCKCIKENRSQYCYRIRFGGYAPGQILTCFFEGMNKTAERAECYGVKLIKKMRFNTHENIMSKRKITENVLGIRYIPDDGINKQLSTRNIIIPPTPPTIREGLISVEYFVAVTAKLSKCTAGLKIEIPVVIGTVPIKQSLQSHQQTEPITPSCFQMADSGEVTFIDPEIDERNRIDDFLPVYPMYRERMPAFF